MVHRTPLALVLLFLPPPLIPVPYHLSYSIHTGLYFLLRQVQPFPRTGIYSTGSLFFLRLQCHFIKKVSLTILFKIAFCGYLFLNYLFVYLFTLQPNISPSFSPSTPSCKSSPHPTFFSFEKGKPPMDVTPPPQVIPPSPITLLQD